MSIKQWFIVKVLIFSLILGCVIAPPVMAQDTPNRIVFSWNRDGDFDLFVMDVDTQQVVSPLTDNTASDLTPVWSPDGTSIALASNVTNTYEIYVLNISTGTSNVLTNNNWDDLYPAWSPDGKKIAFTSNRDSNWDIYVMDANGKNLKRLTKDPVYEGSPVWSPDGEHIAYVEGLDAKRDIKVMDADGSNPQVLTTLATSADYSPAWSPLGNQIAFVSTRSGNPDVF
ncbi:MAG TPA: DPP IV N-terminal domain-containing protein, partial [Phototrophicaceae bacterium]|nr:DPP IV N-terminal domain-containing protein [Phototrophicaceae bacterium]